mmetsp:Transcript_3575/g.7345  ORF Transcript_3575/g.7345 Transcript_3575/m.7345 type:complete len:249 (-) Transcript_3575:284-1030(-)
MRQDGGVWGRLRGKFRQGPGRAARHQLDQRHRSDTAARKVFLHTDHRERRPKKPGHRRQAQRRPHQFHRSGHHRAQHSDTPSRHHTALQEPAPERQAPQVRGAECLSVRRSHRVAGRQVLSGRFCQQAAHRLRRSVAGCIRVVVNVVTVCHHHGPAGPQDHGRPRQHPQRHQKTRRLPRTVRAPLPDHHCRAHPATERDGQLREPHPPVRRLPTARLPGRGLHPNHEPGPDRFGLYHLEPQNTAMPGL